MSAVSILSHEQCQLGEGPFYCARRQTLFWFDILAFRRHAYEFGSETLSSSELPEMTSAMAVVDDDNDVMFTSSGLWLHQIQSGAWSPIVSIEADNETTRSNDARVHPSGAFWLGTMGKNAEDRAGAIYHFRKGELTTLFPEVTIPNGICFSPDGKIAYFTDTLTAKLMRVDLDPQTGLPVANAEVFVDHSGNAGGLDGAVVDGDGNIWIALWGASSVNCYSSDGELLKSIPVEAKQTTCPAFIGDGGLAVTSAWQGMDDAATSADVNAGKTFLIAGAIKPKYEPRVIV